MHRLPCRDAEPAGEGAGGDERNPHPAGERLPDTGSGMFVGCGDVGRDQRRDAPQVVGGDAQKAQPAAARQTGRALGRDFVHPGDHRRGLDLRAFVGKRKAQRHFAAALERRLEVQVDAEDRDVADQAGGLEAVPRHGAALDEGDAAEAAAGLTIHGSARFGLLAAILAPTGAPVDQSFEK